MCVEKKHDKGKENYKNAQAGPKASRQKFKMGAFQMQN